MFASQCVTAKASKSILNTNTDANFLSKVVWLKPYGSTSVQHKNIHSLAVEVAEVFLLSQHLALDPRMRAARVNQTEAEFCGCVEVAGFE